MPPWGRASDVVRIVRGTRGQVSMRTELVIRFDYGSLTPWVSRLGMGRMGRCAPSPGPTWSFCERRHRRVALISKQWVSLRYRPVRPFHSF